MNIILAEDRNGVLQPEKTYTTPVVTIGREAGVCEIVFDKAAYPMVSRKHAEIRFENGEWYLADLQSSYGTFLNSRRVERPVPLPAGSAIQFGTDGPVLKVVWFDVSTEGPAAQPPAMPRAATAQPAVSQPMPQRQTPPPAPTPPPVAAPPPKLPAAALQFVGGSNRPPVSIDKPTIWLGRDPECDVVFDASSATVSRKHAEIKAENGGYSIRDNNSFNGTLINGQRIAASVPLYHNDEIQLGVGGPVLKMVSPERAAPAGASLAGQRSLASAVVPADIASKTMVVRLDTGAGRGGSDGAGEPQLLMTVGFAGKPALTIGRGEGNDIRLDGLQISNRHARLTQSGGDAVIEDLGSTNGVFINGARVSRSTISPNDRVQIGSFVIRLDGASGVGVYDTRAKTRLDVVGLTRDVKVKGGTLRLLDGISLSIQPNEFVGVLGPSGAGKSSLLEALNGVAPAKSGSVLINNLDLYKHYDSLKQAIGYVPQEDIIHRELSVYKTLYYVAKLRLSRDVSSAEIAKIIDEVLDVTGLSDRRNTPVKNLSGGQRKRVSIAVELVTKPSVIFLDEPTSGLDPVTEDKVMRLFRQIAESGRTVVMTTHAMENVRLFDKVVLLMRGRLAFYGTPDDALKYVGASNFKELFEKLEAPVAAGVAKQGESARAALTESASQDWKQKYTRTPQYRELIEKPLAARGTLESASSRKRRRLGVIGAVRQWITLSRRYLDVLLKDKLNLFILFAQPVLIALLTFLVMGSEQPRDFVYFVVSLVAIWFGTSVAAREIIRENPIYRRERMYNLGILPYVGSKFLVLGFIVTVQCLMLFVPLKVFDLVGLMSMPGELGGVPQLWAMLLTAGVGIAIGLFVSAVVRTSEMATSLVPLILIPQILFSGLVGVPSGVNKVVGLTMPSAWSFDTMKRFSTLDTLEREGADPRGKTKGLGLYRFIESENEKTLEKAKRDLEDYKRMGGAQFQDETTGENALNEKLAVPEMKKIPEDLSPYVAFLHPWMNEVLNQIVLMLMFWSMAVLTLIVMRLKDIVK
ncbi:MAG: FHA domain-containing protein [Pyrinomonadaceae bacterium]|nr:FHA domain-containing protein [Pyrinomonadaceae bacterium]